MIRRHTLLLVLLLTAAALLSGCLAPYGYVPRPYRHYSYGYSYWPGHPAPWYRGPVGYGYRGWR